MVAFYPNELIVSVLQLNSTVIKNDELMERANQVRFDAAFVSAMLPCHPHEVQTTSNVDHHQLIDLRLRTLDEIITSSSDDHFDFSNTEATNKCIGTLNEIRLEALQKKETKSVPGGRSSTAASSLTKSPSDSSSKPTSNRFHQSPVHQPDGSYTSEYITECNNILAETVNSSGVLNTKKIVERLTVKDEETVGLSDQSNPMRDNGACLFLSIHDQLKRTKQIDDSMQLDIDEEKKAVARFINTHYQQDHINSANKKDVIYQLLEPNHTWYATGQSDDGLFGQTSSKRELHAETIAIWTFKYYTTTFSCDIVVDSDPLVTVYSNKNDIKTFKNKAKYLVGCNETVDKKDAFLNSIIIEKRGNHYNSCIPTLTPSPS